jgi:ParB family chromosome partitioning protein
MKLEFHQLHRRHEHLRVRNAQRQRQLLASLATAGQQTPIIVVAVSDQPDRYLVIDGYKRVAALEQLGRDTVEAVIWPLNEVQALVLDRSLHWSERESALEEGWLLAELEQRFGYGLEELARQFDRSVSWVSRRLALVELLPDSVQQQVRTGEISAQVAMKYLVPVARGVAPDPTTSPRTTTVVFEGATGSGARRGLPASGTVARSGDGRGHRSSGQPTPTEDARPM